MTKKKINNADIDWTSVPDESGWEPLDNGLRNIDEELIKWIKDYPDKDLVFASIEFDIALQTIYNKVSEWRKEGKLS